MKKIGTREHYVGVTAFRWGFYLQTRRGMRWRHLKVGTWCQHGLRLSTRRQRQVGRVPRYVSFRRVNVSYWTSTKGKSGRARQCGFGWYWG